MKYRKVIFSKRYFISLSSMSWLCMRIFLGGQIKHDNTILISFSYYHVTPRVQYANALAGIFKLVTVFFYGWKG